MISRQISGGEGCMGKNEVFFGLGEARTPVPFFDGLEIMQDRIINDRRKSKRQERRQRNKLKWPKRKKKKAIIDRKTYLSE